MSDIQPTEAEREEAKLFLNRLSHIYEEPDDIDIGPEEEMINAILEYRADAVKAERERVELIITEEILEYDCDLTDLVNTVVSRILSDDQEAHRG